MPPREAPLLLGSVAVAICFSRRVDRVPHGIETRVEKLPDEKAHHAPQLEYAAGNPLLLQHSPSPSPSSLFLLIIIFLLISLFRPAISL